MTSKYPEQPNGDVMAVFNTLKPKYYPLLEKNRTLIRHGTLNFFSVKIGDLLFPSGKFKVRNQCLKPRHFFLFNDCLLITKKLKSNRFRPRVFIHFRPNIQLQERSYSLEFRLLVPVEKGLNQKHVNSRGIKKIEGKRYRSIVMYAKNQQEKDSWMRDLEGCGTTLTSGYLD